MDALFIIPIVLISDTLPWVVLLGYPVLALTTKTFEKAGIGLWIAGLACAAIWVYVGVQSMDYADTNGTTGNSFDGIGWGIASLALVAASIIRALRRRRSAMIKAG